jgi:hypothetical protein
MREGGRPVTVLKKEVVRERKREKERERKRERERQRKKDRERKRKTERERVAGREGGQERENRRMLEKRRKTVRKREGEKERPRGGEGEGERQGGQTGGRERTTGSWTWNEILLTFETTVVTELEQRSSKTGTSLQDHLQSWNRDPPEVQQLQQS